jgi:arylsulfatase A-like enzyme
MRMHPFALGFAVAMVVAGLHAQTRPNFLFIITDDQRWDVLGLVQREQGERGRFPWFTTPNMDRLAAEGVRFRNAFVVQSLCSPSRAAFLTGRYNHANGVRDNSTHFPTNSVTVATQLRAAGYTTAYIGKWHMQDQRGPRPGFDFSASYVGQGKYNDMPFEINGVATETKGWIEDVATDYTMDFIRRNTNRPFLAFLGFKTPHEPSIPPARATNRFAGRLARRVPNLETPAIFKRLGQRSDPQKLPPTGDVRVNLNYFRCLSAVDENVGRLLALLDELHLATNTVVVFTSDNGFYLGEHGGLIDKRTAYDESMRIPMLVRYPPLIKPGSVRDELVLNVDIAPTFLGLAGVAVPSGMQGADFARLFNGQPPAWRSAFLFEYFRDPAYPEVPIAFALRTDSAKLIRYENNPAWVELFDLQHDPYETNNLAHDPAQRGHLERMQAELLRQARAVQLLLPGALEHLP